MKFVRLFSLVLLATLTCASAPRRIEGKHLAIVLSQSADSVRAGKPVTLSASIELPPGMHVYAPGIESPYRPIKIEFETDSRVKIAPLQYPQAKNLYLEAIGETVPVFEGTFKVQTLATVRGKAAGPMQVRAKLTYQTCDDRICYVPQTIPLSWDIDVKP